MPRVSESSDEEEEAHPRKKKMKRLKQKRKSSKAAQEKHTKQAQARAEAAQLAQGRKERKRNEIKAKKAASANDSVATSTHSNAFNPEDPVVGYCDICCMSERYLHDHMALWRCRDCGVLVHDACYGASPELRGRPNPKFRCWACQAVGKTIFVRDRDEFTGKYLAVKQRKRPTECCFCDVDDGVHAMHPIFDAHGKRGRQIYLPKDEDEGKPRRLAWAHTICAYSIGNSRQTLGAVYGAAPDGFVEDEDSDTSLLSDSESINEDLEVEGGGGVSHFVFWGYLHRFTGRDPRKDDAWAKSINDIKNSNLRCQICGKNDKKKVKLSDDGHPVYQNLRIPIQCCANDEWENKMFKKFHKQSMGDENCCIAVHAGCALWGRSDEGEYYRPRASWFFPGFPIEGRLEDPVIENFCPCHAEELFLQEELGGGTDMTNKLPGPFLPLSGAAQKRFEQRARKKANKKRSAKPSATGNDLDSNGSSAAMSRPAKRPSSNSIGPGQVAKAAPWSSKQAPRPPVARVESQSLVNDTRPKKKAKDLTSKKASIKTTRKTTTNAAVQNVSLHGETRRKLPKELKTSGGAMKVQSNKQSRLTNTAKRNSSSLSQGMTAAALQIHHAELNVVQSILDALVKRRNECEERGKVLDQPELVKLRVQLHNKFHDTDVEFKEAWKTANENFNDGILHVKAQTTSTLDTEEEAEDHNNLPHGLDSPPVQRQVEEKEKEFNDDIPYENDDTVNATAGESPANPRKRKLAKMTSAMSGHQSKQEEVWQLRFKELIEFKKRTGHCRVPYRWKENPSLGTWVRTQRLNWKKYPGPGPMTKERYEALDKLDFVWDVSGSNLSPNSKEEADDPQAALVQQIVDDIAKELDAVGQTSDEAGRDEKLVYNVLKARKKHWKKQSGLSKADFSALFHGKVVPGLSEVCDWLQITDKSNSQADETNESSTQAATRDQMGDQDSADQRGGVSNPVSDTVNREGANLQNMQEEPDTEDVANESPKEALEHRKSPENESNHGSFRQHANELGSHDSPGGHTGVPLDDTIPSGSTEIGPPPSQWSFLHYGPHYRKEGFRFDDWSTCEEIDRLSSDDEAVPAF